MLFKSASTDISEEVLPNLNSKFFKTFSNYLIRTLKSPRVIDSFTQVYEHYFLHTLHFT